MIRIISFFRTVSILLFLAALLYGYAMAPSQVYVYRLQEERLYIDNSAFFYLALAVFFVFNIIFFALNYFLRKKGSGRLSLLRAWVTGFSAVFNVFLMLSALAILAVNDRLALSPALLFYGGATLLLIWALGLIHVFGRLKTR